MYKPSRKGIVLNKRNYLLVTEDFKKNHEKILDWLGITYVPEHIENYSQRQNETLNNLEYKLGEISASKSKNGNQELLYQYQSLGGLEKIIYNESHSFNEEIDKITGPEIEFNMFKTLLDLLLISYEKTKEKFSGIPVSNTDIFFENFQTVWFEILRRSIEEE